MSTLQVWCLIRGLRTPTIQTTYRKCGTRIGGIFRRKALHQSGLVSLAQNCRLLQIDNGLQAWSVTWAQVLGGSIGRTGRGIPTLVILAVSWSMTGKQLTSRSSNTSI